MVYNKHVQTRNLCTPNVYMLQIVRVAVVLRCGAHTDSAVLIYEPTAYDTQMQSPFMHAHRLCETHRV